jgi:single-strand DNA-binding protein
MAEITISVSGNLVSDVAFQVTGRGDALARFRLASTAKRFDRGTGRWVDGDTTYWNVTAWRRAAENARDSLAKGHPVLVTGRVRQRTVDRQVDGAPGTTVPVTYTDIDATGFGLDLSRCRAQFQRAPIGPQTSELRSDEAPSPAPAASSGAGTEAGRAAEQSGSEGLAA